MSAPPREHTPRGPAARWAALPLGTRWVLTFLILCGLSAGIVLAVHEANQGALTNTDQAVAESDAVGRVAIAQDEAPHTANLPRHATRRQVTGALVRGITADVQLRIHQQDIDGPFNSVTCAPGGPSVAGREPFRCTASASNFNYPFLAVADVRTRLVEWCKQDTAPSDMPQLAVPVNSGCVR